MEKKIFLIISTFVALSIIFSGCSESNTSSSNDKSKFIGTWQNINSTYFTMNYTFFENGTVVQTNSMMNWVEYWYNYEITDDQICLEFIETKVSGCMTYSFSEDNTLLTFESIDDPGYPEVYRKIS